MRGMKIKRVISLMIFPFALLSASDYTKLEITTYIKNRVDHDSNPKFNHQYTINFKNNMCSFSLHDIGEYGITDWDIDLKLVTVSFSNTGTYYVNFDCVSNKECVRYKYDNGSKIHRQTSMGIYTNNANTIKLYNAFNDLSMKCKGMKELY